MPGDLIILPSRAPVSLDKRSQWHALTTVFSEQFGLPVAKNLGLGGKPLFCPILPHTERNGTPKLEEKKCIPHWMRTRNLSSSYAPVLWIHGPSGAGKSAISQAIFMELSAKNWFPPSFFGRTPTNNPSAHFVRKILFDLVEGRPELRRPVSRTFDSYPAIWDASLEEQLQILIINTFQATSFVQRLDRVRKKKPDLILLNSLNEVNDAERTLDVNFLNLSKGRLPLRSVISTHIDIRLTSLLDTHTHRSRICLIEFRANCLDPELFPTFWPSYEDFEAVVQNAQGRFLDMLGDTRANDDQQSPFNCLLRYILPKGSQYRRDPDVFMALPHHCLCNSSAVFPSNLPQTPTQFHAQLETLRCMVKYGNIKLVEWHTDEEAKFHRHTITVLWEQWGTFITSSREPDEIVLSHLLELDLSSVLFNRALSILLAEFRPFPSLFRNLNMVADWLKGREIPDAKRLHRRLTNAQQTLHVRATISPAVKDDLLTWVIFDLGFCKYVSNSTNRAQHSIRASAPNITFVAV
ncbi:hypothetical protein PM082_017800 [Marasmius tenuissimus]|nr:hypothetical protein PM082_017800 [Marasmius tenuissimus]